MSFRALATTVGVAILLGVSGSANAADPTHVAAGTVLQPPGEAPRLCLGAVQLSLPPRCGGPSVVGWDWTPISDKETYKGTTWGPFIVVGTFDPQAFTFTSTDPPEPATPDMLDDAWVPPDTTTRCPRPARGWPAAGRIRDEDADRVLRWLRRNPDLGAAWVDYRDRYRVLNVRFTRNPRANRVALRARYRGNLCVVKAGGPTLTKLQQARRDALATATPWNRLRADIDDREARVTLDVVYDDGSLQRTFDERLGAGLVRVRSHITRL